MKLSYSVGISTKLIFVVTAIIVAAIGAVIYIATDLYQEESINRIQVNNKDAVFNSSQKIQNTLEDSIQQMKLMAKVLEDNGLESEQTQNTIYRILSGFDRFISFHIYRKKSDATYELVFSSILETSLSEFGLSDRQVVALPEMQILNQAAKEKLFLVNSGVHLKRPILTLAFRSENQDQQKEEWLFRSEIRQSALLSALPENQEITSFIVNQEGEVLSHTDQQARHKIMEGLSFSNKDFVQRMLAAKSDNQLVEFSENAETYLGAYRKIPMLDLYVVAQVPKSSALATIEQVQYRSLLVMLIVISLAFIINYLFSHSLTGPLKNLYQATEKIVDGDYNIELHRSSSDEVGALTEAFNDMASGLKEREKIKTAFNKFHSKEVAQKLLAGEIKLGGEKKMVTMLFSDIRGFTALSETLSPDEVVLLLNEYLSAMVSIIYKWNGVVDKFIGDAIMAVWGAPESKPEDAYNATRAALEMRAFMKKWKDTRTAEGKETFDIGIGLHTGEVLAGNIGSEERLEYTCIGDSVNQTSRIEASTKVVGSDILVSKATATLVKEKGIHLGPVLEIAAKGKSKPIQVQQVIGYRNQEGELETTLSAEEVAKMQEQVQTSFAVEEEKTSLIAPDPSAEQSEERFVVRDAGKVQGPYSLEEMKVKVGGGEINPKEATVFSESGQTATALLSLEELERRSGKAKPINIPPPPEEVREKAFQNEWYIAGPTGEVVGPYSYHELDAYLKEGRIQRTTYVWRSGLEDWIYLYQVPGFERRGA